jgi:CRP-like cAMP-binding protein
LLSNNLPIVQGLFRMLLRDPSAGGQRILNTAGPARASKGLSETLTSIEKVIALQPIPIFSRASADHLIRLAAIARQLPLTAAGSLFSEGDRPAIYVVLGGRLALDPPGGGESIFAGLGDIVGVYETLSGAEMGWRARTLEPGTVLRLDHDELLDLLADNVDLLQGVFSALLRDRSVAAVAASGR